MALSEQSDRAAEVQAQLARRRAQRGFDWGRSLLHVAVGAVFFFLMFPLLIVFPISFSSASYLRFPPPGFSLRWYENFFNDYLWIDATIRSFKVGIFTMVFATLLGTMLAFALVRGRFFGKALVNQLSLSPIIVPTIIYAVGVFYFFSKIGFVGHWTSIGIAHTVHAIPFVVLVVGASLRTYDVNYELAAMGLGASRLGAVWRVTLPQIRPAIVSAAFIAFIISFDELIIALFLADVYMTLPKLMFDNILFEIDPTIAAVSVLQILLVVVVLLLAHRFGQGARVQS